MTFASPNVLWLLMLIPALFAFFWWSWRARQRLMTEFIQARLLPGLTVGLSPARQRIRLACMLLAVICLILALARPQWGFDWEAAKQRGLDIVVAIDTSKSMLAEDIAPNRLARAKLAALDLMQQARSDRLGLVAFAGSAFLQCPLTIDDGAFRQSVEALDVNIIPQGGTALAEAIEAASGAFKEGDNNKIMVLMTDGEDQDSGAVEAATKAAEAGLKIFTVGIGSKEGELLRVKDAKGRTDYIRDEQGNVVKSHLNESLLQEIAGAAKGVYYPLRGAKTMDTLNRDWLAPLPKSDSEEKLIRRPHERYHWPLAFGMILLIVEMLLPERKRESSTKVVGQASRLPSPSPAAKPPAAAAPAAITALILLALPISGLGSPSGALREYKAGQYDQALKDYERLIERKGDDPRLRFNAGAAAYQAKKYEEAAKQFDEAVAAPDLKLQQHAYFNRGNTPYYLGENNLDPNNRTETWKKAVKDYENALKINQEDKDAKYNLEFVKKKLEELKQQQQQSNKNKDDKNQDQNQNQDQQQQQDQKKDESKKDQEQKSDQQKQQDQNQSQQKQDQQKQDAQKQKEEEQKQQQAKADQQKKDEQEKQKEQQQQAKQSKEKPDDKESQEQQMAAAAPGQMTPQQAQQLLDSDKGQEQMLPIKPNPKPTDSNKPVKDW